MICNNCGTHFKSSLTCPVCGQRWKSRDKCPVCQTSIHYGQSRCFNCGNPLSYESNQEVVITKQGNNKTKNKKTISFPHLEMYDYKSSNQEIKKRFDEARATVMRRKEKKSNQKVAQLTRIAAGLVFVLGLMGSLVGVVVDFVAENDIDFGFITNILDDSLDEVSLTTMNDDLTNQGNYNQNNYILYNGNDVFISDGMSVYQTDSDLMDFTLYDLPGTASLYLEDNYLYVENYGEYFRYNLLTEQYEYLFDMEVLQPIGNNSFLYLDIQDNLYLYQDDISYLLVDEFVYSFSYDQVNSLIYVALNDNQVKVLDLSGQEVNSLTLGCYDDMYVYDQSIYYHDYDAIYRYDIQNDVVTSLLQEDVYISDFIITGNGIVYTNDNYELNYYDQNDDVVYNISDEVERFNVVGEYIYFERYDDGYNWYFSDKYGNTLALNSIF